MKKTIHLQGIGEHQAEEVQDLTPGTVTVWNYGVEAVIAGVKPSKSGKTFRIVYEDGSIDHRAMRRGRLVGVVRK